MKIYKKGSGKKLIVGGVVLVLIGIVLQGPFWYILGAVIVVIGIYDLAAHRGQDKSEAVWASSLSDEQQRQASINGLNFNERAALKRESLRMLREQEEKHKSE